MIGAQVLAYLGDAVFELYVREMLTLKSAGRPVKELNKLARQYVSAPAQARMYHRIFDALTPDEQAVIRRGRNLNPASRAKNANVTEYRHATGLETLFGYLYSEGQTRRMCELFDLCTAPQNDQLTLEEIDLAASVDTFKNMSGDNNG